MLIGNRTQENKKHGLLTAGLLTAVLGISVLLAACQPAAQSVAQPADQAAQTQGDGGGNGQRPNFQMQPAPELPTTAATLRGSLVKIDGNTLIVQEGGFNFGQGNGTPRPRPTPDGTPRPRPTRVAGPQVQVTVSGDTQYYQDVTFANLNGQPPSGTIQQKVEKSSLDALAANERVTVWGDKSGDQITAKVIVFSQFRGGRPQQQQPQTQ